ncbi:MAG: hypothetical protein WA718_04635 [Terriglobales bacterium]
MHSSLVLRSKPFLSIRIALVAVLALLLSGWTCSGMFESCQAVMAQPQIISLLPGSVPDDTSSVPLTVEGSGFTPQSQILWNGSTLETTFLDSRHLQTTITQETFASFGGEAGSSVRIAVRPVGAGGDGGCPKNADSAALALVID